MKKNYSDFAKRNFEYYKAEKRRKHFNTTMEVFEVVKMFDEIYQDFGIDENLIKKENKKNK